MNFLDFFGLENIKNNDDFWKKIKITVLIEKSLNNPRIRWNLIISTKFYAKF